MSKINLKDLIQNDIELDENMVWKLVNEKQINYSDGRSTERYLEKVFLKTVDLSFNSYELENYIKDWPTEYHLTRKRAQLLSCFEFDKSRKVLEVGCGCGAITRFLGETFNDVLAVEGSIARSHLARLRTRDLDNVSIICAPFQELKFREPFDIIFCIGVFEYAKMFVDSPDPYDAVLQYFNSALASDGVLVIGIENQFGLKYFASKREDHTGLSFDGLEGYPRFTNRARTFGYDELKRRINEYFATIEYYFPYPDYKVPSCILSERFMRKAKTSELIGNFQSRDYFYDRKPLFEEKLVLIALDKNNKLPFFSNSFLVIAGKKDISSVKFKQLGLFYSSNRLKEFQTVTRFVEREDGRIWSEKAPMNASAEVKSGNLILKPITAEWIHGFSLQTELMMRCKEENINIYELFAPCKIWLKKLKSLAAKDNPLWIDGKYIDCVWKNSYIRNGQCDFIDLEWEYQDRLQLKTIVIRSIFLFLNEILSISDVASCLKFYSMKKLIIKIADALGEDISKTDFKEFYKLNTEITNIVHSPNVYLSKLSLRLKVNNILLFNFFRYLFYYKKHIFHFYKMTIRGLRKIIKQSY